MIRMRYAEVLNCLLATPGCNVLSGAARRARREAAGRRVRQIIAYRRSNSGAPMDRLDPTRYGDWETGGLCRDF